MSRWQVVAAVAAVSTGVAGGGLVRQARRRRWQVITVNREVDAVAPGAVLRGPVADLGDRVETAVSPAVGRGGTEVRARFRPNVPGSSDRTELRLALRRTKQLVETGEILAVDPQPAGNRPRTPAGSLLDAVVRRAPKEGVL
jgi:hypothetical protein